MGKRTWISIAAIAVLIGGGLLYRQLAQDVDSRGATRLMRALEENDTEKAAELLTAGDVNVRDKAGQTALFYAARHATDPKVIYRLIVAGADPLATDKTGNTPLTAAAKYNPSTKIVMALAKQGNKHPQQQQINKNKALQRAAKYNNAAVIKTLLIAYASPTIEETSAAEYLKENEQLSEQEKADYRQVMLMLEILEAREQFANKQTVNPKPHAPKSQKTSPEKATASDGKKGAGAAEKQAVLKPAEDKQAVPVPQEKQMALTE